jgi:N-acetylglutamate synthase-like GNAT family acetyltransferase
LIAIERLPIGEFGKLQEFGEGIVPDPQRTVVVVAKFSEQIIGKIALMAPAHVEGLYIEKPWRNGPVLKMLVKGIEREAKAVGLTKLFAYGANETMNGYIKRLGYQRSNLVVWEKDI